jgi:hypothetical protein
LLLILIKNIVYWVWDYFDVGGVLLIAVYNMISS